MSFFIAWFSIVSHHSMDYILHAKLSGTYEDLMSPLDAKVLLQKCLGFLSRVQQASSNTLAIANFLKNYDSISHVNYPKMVASTPLYKQYRRPDGSLISIVFKNPDSAMQSNVKVPVLEPISTLCCLILSLPMLMSWTGRNRSIYRDIW